MIKYYECKYCNAKFVKEGNFKKHDCEKKKRYEKLKKPLGQAAYTAYGMWMNKKGRMTPPKETFIDSSYYKPFIKFIKFSNKVAIPDREGYIEYMAKKGMNPSSWSNLEVYKDFINHFDKTYTPKQKAKITVETFNELSRIFECDISEVFEHLEAGSLIKLIQARKLSPWVLLFSKSFLSFIEKDMNSAQRARIQFYIDDKIWNKEFQKRPKDVESMKKYVKAMKL